MPRNVSVAIGQIGTSVNGAASAPPLSLTGTIFTGGSATTTKPHLLIEPAGTTSTGWNTAGTLFGGNAPTGFTGAHFDAQINGVTCFRINCLAGASTTLKDATGQLKLSSTNSSVMFLDQSSFYPLSSGISCGRESEGVWNFLQCYGGVKAGASFNAAMDVGWSRIAANIWRATNASTGGGAVELLEMTAPAAGAANTVRLYAQDNGAGKTQVMALFNTGAAVQVAIEP